MLAIMRMGLTFPSNFLMDKIPYNVFNQKKDIEKSVTELSKKGQQLRGSSSWKSISNRSSLCESFCSMVDTVTPTLPISGP